MRRRNPHARGDGPCSGPDSCAESPRAWGWTAAPAGGSRGIPTRVGMDRTTSARSALARNPHARGDGPYADKGPREIELESPRAWGWTDRGVGRGPVDGIPTRVGMDRSANPTTCSSSRNPHARGDGPAFGLIVTQKQGIPTRVGMDRTAGTSNDGACPESPRAWGWTV